jgi:hypothetical protein
MTSEVLQTATPAEAEMAAVAHQIVILFVGMGLNRKRR